MAHIINTARTKHRSLVITLLDLKNAFGELHHNLIYEVLRYHHIPDPINKLIKSLYTNFQTSIKTDQFSTPFITVGRDVLQGDCLSPLLFNMSFNTFIQHIKSESYTQLGFWKFNKSGIPCNPIHWFQFADDAAVISSQERESQILLNRFSVWCQWANMIIRVDKCSTFGIKKHSSKSIQYQPKLFIRSAIYLYPVSKSANASATLVVILILTCQIKNTNRRYVTCSVILFLKLTNYLYTPKIKSYCTAKLLSKISWDLTITDISQTWACETLDCIATKYFRKWLELPISATLSNVFLPKNKFGLNVILPSTKFVQCQTVSRSALRSSINENIATWIMVCNKLQQEHSVRYLYNHKGCIKGI